MVKIWKHFWGVVGALMIQNPQEITPVTAKRRINISVSIRFQTTNDKMSKTKGDEVALKVKNIRFKTCVDKFFTSAIDYYMH
jgi:hypothetical protein